MSRKGTLAKEQELPLAEQKEHGRCLHVRVIGCAGRLVRVHVNYGTIVLLATKKSQQK